MTTLADGGAIPVGTILPFGGTIASLPDGFLSCNGASISRNDFADLFAVIGTQWGTVDGLTYNIPTTQGLLLRGVAYGSTNDEDRASRTAVQAGGQAGDEVGSFQNDRFQVHSHRTHNAWSVTNVTRVNGISGHANGNGFFNSVANRMWLGNGSDGGNSKTGFNGNANDNNVRGKTIATTNVGNAQTVGKNVYVNYIIKY